MLKFGIVIPNLNNTKYIPSAIESVLHQDILKEIAIIDGGSVDGIDKIAEQYHNVIDYYVSKKDKGQSYAIAEGTSKINADIFCWLNSDDYYFPHCLEKVADIFQKHADIDVVYGDAVHVTTNGSFISYFHPIKEHKKSRIGYDNYICQPACFVRREAYDKIGGINKKLIYTMDWDLWCRLSEKNYKFYYLKRPIAAVRYYKGTKTFTNSFRRYWEIFRINLKFGRIFLPVSLIGANYYELSLKDRLSITEKLYLKYFEGLRGLVHKFKSNDIKENADEDLYGLGKWNNTVKNKCRISFPRYSTFTWKAVELNVNDSAMIYTIHANGTFINYSIIDKERITIPINQIHELLLTIEIESKEGSTLQLKELACN